MEEILNTDLCAWNIFDDPTKVVMGIGLYITGLFAVVLNVWLLLVFVNGSLCNKSYFMIMHLCLVSLARSLLAGFPLTGTSAIAQRWIFGDTCCKVYGFFNVFIAVYQIESVTHLCIERYVAAKYVKLGQEMSPKHYALFVALCWLFSIVYSMPSLAGFGSISCDLTRTACQLSFLWIGSQWWQCWYILMLVLLGGVKPVLVMLWMLSQTKQLEKHYYTVENHKEQLILTNTVISVTKALLLCWTPQALLVCWLLLPQLLIGSVLHPLPLLLLAVSIASEMAPSIPVLVYLWTNQRIRAAMMSLWKSDRKQE